MKNYNGASSFFKDFSKRAIMARSINEIMQALPMIGYFIAAGAFTVNFYKIFSNRFSTDSRKLKELSGFMFNAGVTVGSSVAGAVAGQILIPIPFFGAFIGTVVGGMIGDSSAKQVNSWIENKRFKKII